MNVVDLIERGWWTSARAWSEAKNWLELAAPIDNTVLHVVVGLLIFGTAGFVSKRAKPWLPAWALTLAFTLWNELVDITTERWPDVTEQFAEGALDIGVTMALPTLLTARWVRGSRPLVPAHVDVGADRSLAPRPLERPPV